MKNSRNEKVSAGKTAGRRGLIFASAALCALALSTAVFAAVTYDSSKDPVVAYSAMTAYVGGQLADINSRLASAEERIAVIEVSGGGGGSSSGGGISNEGAAQILSRLTALESSVSALQQENTSLRSDLDRARSDLGALVAGLQSDLNSLSSDISGLSDDISGLRTSLNSAKSDISTLKTDFRQISDISTKLNTLTYRLNSLSSEDGEIGALKKQAEQLAADYGALLEKAGRLYEAVHVPYGSTVFAKDAEDSIVVVLRTGSAEAVSPYTELGTAQGLNDLSDGGELYHGDRLELFHNVLVPRGGTDGRGVRVTSLEGAYLMIGGDYTVVEP
ncbi:MAG: hypothetical protein IJU46_05970 [Clostridia bacterium]|nr:hypothetical protein [Clostridia bacterium]